MLVLIAACASPVSTAEQAITNGAPDLADPAVIGLVDELGEVGCTASMIDTHTAITAAHCIAGRDPRTLRALTGASTTDGSFGAIAHGEIDPAFDPATLAHDLAMITLRDAHDDVLAFAPVDAALAGTNVRAVGFGTTAAATTDGGVKRAGTAMVTEVQADEVVTMPAPAQACHGDSGGPMVTSAGVAAVASRGDAMCSDHATYARIDIARAGFIDPYLAATAPGTAPTDAPCFYEGHCALGDECQGSGSAFTCVPLPDGGCQGCAAGGGAPAWLAVIALVGFGRGRRSGRSASPRDNRAGR